MTGVPLDRLPAITVRQPWARCIAIGAKTVENRGRHVSYRGPIAIHAGKTLDNAANRDPRVMRLWGPEATVGAPLGAVLAVAELTDCHAAVQHLTGATCCQPWGERLHNGQPGCHLVLANVRLLDHYVYVRGALQVPWVLTADDTAKVYAELAKEGATR